MSSLPLRASHHQGFGAGIQRMQRLDLLGKLLVDSQQSLSFHISRTALENWRESSHLAWRRISRDTSRLLWKSIFPVSMSVYWEDRLKSRAGEGCTLHRLSPLGSRGIRALELLGKTHSPNSGCKVGLRGEDSRSCVHLSSQKRDIMRWSLFLVVLWMCW